MQAAAQHLYEVNGRIGGQLSPLMTRLEPLASTGQSSHLGLGRRGVDDERRVSG